jgi:hypothetical protein
LKSQKRSNSIFIKIFGEIIMNFYNKKFGKINRRYKCKFEEIVESVRQGESNLVGMIQKHFPRGAGGNSTTLLYALVEYAEQNCERE